MRVDLRRLYLRDVGVHDRKGPVVFLDNCRYGRIKRLNQAPSRIKLCRKKNSRNAWIESPNCPSYGVLFGAVVFGHPLVGPVSYVSFGDKRESRGVKNKVRARNDF